MRQLIASTLQHEPGEDVYGYESPEERWRPVLSVAAIVCAIFRFCIESDYAHDFARGVNALQIQSVLSMLTADQPNLESPANVDAAVRF